MLNCVKEAQSGPLCPHQSCAHIDPRLLNTQVPTHTRVGMKQRCVRSYMCSYGLTHIIHITGGSWASTNNLPPVFQSWQSSLLCYHVQSFHPFAFSLPFITIVVLMLLSWLTFSYRCCNIYILFYFLDLNWCGTVTGPPSGIRHHLWCDYITLALFAASLSLLLQHAVCSPWSCQLLGEHLFARLSFVLVFLKPTKCYILVFSTVVSKPLHLLCGDKKIVL